MVQYVRFDWAMKRLLRNKANYVVLEGLLTTLLEKQIKIKELLESESNQDSEEGKHNRVDVLAEDETGALYLIEVQNNSEISYFQRMLFGTSKLITDYIQKGDNYDKIRKIYSINIVYFNLGCGTDYVYHGTTEFRGIHNDEVLNLSPFQMERFHAKEVKDIFPEYYILKVDGFDRVAVTPLEEWIHFLKDGTVADQPQAQGLEEAKAVMRYDTMEESERRRYDRMLMDAAIIRDNVSTARLEGHAEGKAEGRLEGHAEGKAEGIAEGIAKGIAKGKAEGIAEGKKAQVLEMARKMLSKGFSLADVAELTGLDLQDIECLP